MTTVLPAARAGAIFQVASRSGKLNGVIAPTTPSGSRTVYDSMSPGTGRVSPWIFVANPAKYSKQSTESGTSICEDSRMGLPLLADSRRAISSRAASSSAAIRSR